MWFLPSYRSKKWLSLPHQRPRMQLGREVLIVGGFPIDEVPQLVRRTKECDMMSIGGNMMIGPVLLGVLMSLLESAMWRKSPTVPNVCESEAHGVMQLFLSSTTQDDDDCVEHSERAAQKTSAGLKKRRLHNP